MILCPTVGRYTLLLQQSSTQVEKIEDGIKPMQNTAWCTFPAVIGCEVGYSLDRLQRERTGQHKEANTQGQF